MTKITIDGQIFTREDLKEIARALRRVEQRHPEKRFFMIINEPSITLEKTMALTAEIYQATLEEMK